MTKPERNALVFDGRNRAYGAFVLRREYDRRFVWAFMGAIGLFATGIAVPKALGALGVWSVPEGLPIPTIPKEWIIETFLPEKPPQAPKPSQPKQAASTVPTKSDDPNVVVVPKDSVADATPKDTITVDPGPPNLGPVGPGVPGKGPGFIPDPDGGEGKDKFTVEAPGNPGIVDVAPEFIGGQAAMAKFIQDHLRVTNEDITQAHEQVVFVIDIDGSVVRVKARGRSVKDFSEAAERVVRAMPKWKPAKYKGKEVPCVMVLPIEFQTR